MAEVVAGLASVLLGLAPIDMVRVSFNVSSESWPELFYREMLRFQRVFCVQRTV